MALVRLAPSLGWELLAFQRQVEAREEFTLRDRQAAIQFRLISARGSG